MRWSFEGPTTASWTRRLDVEAPGCQPFAEVFVRHRAFDESTDLGIDPVARGERARDPLNARVDLPQEPSFLGGRRNSLATSPRSSQLIAWRLRLRIKALPVSTRETRRPPHGTPTDAVNRHPESPGPTGASRSRQVLPEGSRA